MLEERPLEELPARASASAGANATLAQTNSARRMRQFINRLAIAPPVRNFSRRPNAAEYGVSPHRRKHPLLGISAPTRSTSHRRCRRQGMPDVPTNARLIAEALVPKYFVITRHASGRRNRARFAALAHRRGEAHVATVAVQLAAPLGVRPFRARPRPSQQDFERRISSL